MAEWSKAAVSKTVIPSGIGGSNPSSSATSPLRPNGFKSSLFFGNGRIRFKSSKTSREFVINFPPILLAEMHKLPESDSEWLFPNPFNGKPYRDLRVALASKRAGIRPPVALHMIRHLAADEVAKITGSTFFTQKHIGWSSPEMVDRYTHVENWTAPIVAAFDERIQDALSGSASRAQRGLKKQHAQLHPSYAEHFGSVLQIPAERHDV